MPPSALFLPDSARNSTKSLTGSAIEHYFENGRRYCSESYYMPNDDEEQTRLAITHQAFLHILGDEGLTMARVPPDVERILDIGTGTGDVLPPKLTPLSTMLTER